MEQPEYQRRHFRIRLHAEPPPPRAQVVERLVDDRQPDHGVDEVRVHPDARQHAGQQRDRVADGEQRHVDADVAQPVQEEHDAQQEQDVVEPGHHVLGAEVRERHQPHAGGGFDVTLVALGDAMGGDLRHEQEHEWHQRPQPARDGRDRKSSEHESGVGSVSVRRNGMRGPPSGEPRITDHTSGRRYYSQVVVAPASQ